MMSLFDIEPEAHFDGADYDPKLDKERLTGQIRRVYDAMKDGRWRTVEQIVDMTGDPANSVQAQLRNLRKERFGSYLVERRRVTASGLYEFRVGEKGAAPAKKVNACPNCGHAL
jgi:hypothetical protein